MAKTVAVLAAALLLLAAMRAGGAAAQQCDASNLSSCAIAFTIGGPPSQTCCDKLREEQQKGCLCLYASDPLYSSFLNSTTARKALASCGVAFPTCS
ncbi:unnamed protein product [Urochloa decumbens]|uniref:Bifunctional inhibitor/plant lipid transfer protein/seed storage helical domain-containing protein n=1 Tax=Urochloa decumbens TaxID=240449 RepID=A0ABC8Y0T7_9POAL